MRGLMGAVIVHLSLVGLTACGDDAAGDGCADCMDGGETPERDGGLPDDGGPDDGGPDDATTECVPAAEEDCALDGDEDCDGLTDEGCPACEAGSTRGCGIDVGQCELGTQTCDATGEWSTECVGGITPVDERCNGLDDDCDTNVDEGDPDGGAACGSDVGACAMGTTHCVGGSLACDGEVGPGVEACDNVDNDCDSIIDEENPGGGAACGSNVGACTAGTTRCDAGSLTCDGEVTPVIETCDDVDNDCDSIIDEGNPGGGAACGSSVGTCTMGTELCSGGTFICDGAVGPGAEACDGADNDCNGAVDDSSAFECALGETSVACTTTCGTTGTGTCTAACLAPTAADCTPPAEACNWRDDDCDGLSDEGVASYHHLPGQGAADTDDVRLVAVRYGWIAVRLLNGDLTARAHWETGQPRRPAFTVENGAQVGRFDAWALDARRVLVTYAQGATVRTRLITVNDDSEYVSGSRTLATDASVAGSVAAAGTPSAIYYAYVNDAGNLVLVYSPGFSGTFTPTVTSQSVPVFDFQAIDMAAVPNGTVQIAYVNDGTTDHVFYHRLYTEGSAPRLAGGVDLGAGSRPVVASDTNRDFAVAWTDASARLRFRLHEYPATVPSTTTTTVYTGVERATRRQVGVAFEGGGWWFAFRYNVEFLGVRAYSPSRSIYYTADLRPYRAANAMDIAGTVPGQTFLRGGGVLIHDADVYDLEGYRIGCAP